jgi:hypothetical protein
MASRKIAHSVLLVALVVATSWSYSCAAGKSNGQGFSGGSADGGAGSAGTTGDSGVAGDVTLAGDGGVPGLGGDGGGPPSGPVLTCPSPTTANDFASPILDKGAPTNAAALFSAPDVGTGGPCVYEPEMGALFPNNWIRLRFRFTTSQSENLFEIKLVVPNETSPLVIYTAQTSYTLDAATWAKITTTGVNAPIQVTVRSAVVTNGSVSGGPWTGSTGTIEIAPVPAGGSVVYWTTSNGTVLKGFQMGSESTPQPVLTPTQASTQCIGCHTSTPDGLYVGLTASSVAGTADSPAYVDLRSVDGGAQEPSFVSQSALALLAVQAQHAPSFSPSHWSPGDHVALSMLETTVGNNSGPTSEIAWTNLEATSQAQGKGWAVVARNGDPNQAASASFSHDGQTIVYTSTTGDVNSGVSTNDGVLHTVPYAGGAGGAAQPLKGASDPSYIQFYPSFSHDDALVAFNRIPTSAASASSPPTYNNPNSEVFVVPASGGTATRIAANDPPACLHAPSPGITNSWAKWSPQVLSVCNKTFYFLVFSSNRDPGASGGPQLYVAPMVVDASGALTTYPAIYPWNQPEAEHNHTPAWDAFQLPPPPPPPQ